MIAEMSPFNRHYDVRLERQSAGSSSARHDGEVSEPDPPGMKLQSDVDLTGWLWTGLIERISLDQRSWG